MLPKCLKYLYNFPFFTVIFLALQVVIYFLIHTSLLSCIVRMEWNGKFDT